MKYLKRAILPLFQQSLERAKSILLLGPRQTGKTTLVTEFLQPDISMSFVKLETRLRYEKDPSQFEKDLEYAIAQLPSKPCVFIDEVQKVPAVMDSIQYLIDEGKAQFILSGSSARKLKHGSNVNLLPGRVVNITMDALSYSELPESNRDLDDLLIYGSLPHIILEKDRVLCENDLMDYVKTYLEEEIRQEALVRNIGAFSRFLELAAIESGNLINFTKISQDVGVSDHTIKEYFQILEDCLIVFKVAPLSISASRRRLLKSPKYLFFDLGVRRLAANEGPQASLKQKAKWFEQYIGVELVRLIHIHKLNYKLLHWRDTQGVEVDYVLDMNGEYIPIEVKWSETPAEKDARHLMKFMDEYQVKSAYIVCRTPKTYLLNHKITVIAWHELITVMRAD